MATDQLSERPILALSAAVALHLILISAQVNTAAGIPFIQVVTFGAFSEVQRAATAGADTVRQLWGGYVALQSAHAENQALKRELYALQVRMQEERARAERAENYRQLLELRQRAVVQTVAAELIAGPADPAFRDMTIDKGTNDGLARDMAVLSPDGIVGRVILTGRRAARVQMLIDTSAAAGAMIERSRVQGLVAGQGTTLRMDYVPNTADVKPGDLVVTSGLDKVYPKGFVIGTIDTVVRQPGSYYEISVRPAVDFTRLEEVLVVTSPPAGALADDLAGDTSPSNAPPVPTRPPQ